MCIFLRMALRSDGGPFQRITQNLHAKHLLWFLYRRIRLWCTHIYLRYTCLPIHRMNSLPSYFRTFFSPFFPLFLSILFSFRAIVFPSSSFPSSCRISPCHYFDLFSFHIEKYLSHCACYWLLFSVWLWLWWCACGSTKKRKKENRIRQYYRKRWCCCCGCCCRCYLWWWLWWFFPCCHIFLCAKCTFV